MSGRMVGDAGEHVGNVELRIEAVELGAFDHRIYRRGAASPGVGAGEQPVFPTDRNRAVILPMSGKRSRSITAGTHFMGVGRQYIERRADGEVVHVEVAPGVVIAVAAWMLDSAACPGMELGAPRVTLSALAELHRLLIEYGFRRSSSSDGGAT
jgi:hypothetical protein